MWERGRECICASVLKWFCTFPACWQLCAFPNYADEIKGLWRYHKGTHSFSLLRIYACSTVMLYSYGGHAQDQGESASVAKKEKRLNNVFSVKIRWKLLKEAKSLLTWGEVSLIQQPLLTSSVTMSIGQRRNVIMSINNSMWVCVHVCFCVCFCVWYYVLFDWAVAQLCSKSP